MAGPTLITVPAPFRNHPVIPYAPNRKGDRPHDWLLPAKVDTNPAGLSVAATQLTQGPEQITLGYEGLTRSQARTLESFVNDRKGRQEGFWCPSFQHDFVVVTAGASGVPFTVIDWGYAENVFSLGFPYTQFAGYYPTTGWYLGELISAGSPYPGLWLYGNGTAAVGDVETIRNKTTAQGLRVMRLLWVRLADDAIKTEWAHPNFATIELTVVSNSPDAPTH